MANAYVRVPLHARLSFPDVCPFSGSPNPPSKVTIRYPRFGFRIPIPILGAIWATPPTRLRFPSSSFRGQLDKFLSVFGFLLGLAIVVIVAVGKAVNASDEEISRATGGRTTAKETHWLL